MVLFPFYILYMNVMHPYMPGDDYMFMMKMSNTGQGGPENILSFADFLESQTNIFYYCHYRILVHSLLQVMFLCSPWVFDILNTIIIFIVPCLLIPRADTVNRTDYIVLYFIVISLIWLFHFDLGHGYFWTTGAVNYTWTLIPSLLFIRSFLLFYKTQLRSHLLMCLWLAPLVASVNENALLSISIMTGIYSLVIWRQLTGKKRMILVLILGILFVGGLIMISSPSAAARLEREGGFLFSNYSSMFIEFSKRTAYYIVRICPAVLSLYMFLQLPPLSNEYNSKKKVLITRLKSYKLLYMMGIIILSFLAMFAAPIFEPRTAIFPFFISLMASFYSTDNQLTFRSQLPVKLLTLVLVMIVVSINRGLVYYQLHESHDVEYASLSAPGSHNTLRKICPTGQLDYLACYDLQADRSYLNESLENYYHKSEIILSQDQNKNRLLKDHNDRLGANRLLEYNKVFTGKDYTIWSKIDTEKMYIVLQSEIALPNDYIMIVRGQGHSLRHKIIALLPMNIQIYFRDFLEYSGGFRKDGKTSVILIDGLYYLSQVVLSPDDYKDFIVGLYSIKEHNVVSDLTTIKK